MSKMLIKIPVSPERDVSKIKYLFYHIMRNRKQYIAKALELFQSLLAAFVTVSFWQQKTNSSNSSLNEEAFSYFFIYFLLLLLDCCYFYISWGEGKDGSGLSVQQWQSLIWPCRSLFVLLNALEAHTQNESSQNNNGKSCNSFSSVLMKIKGLTLWIHLGLTN